MDNQELNIRIALITENLMRIRDRLRSVSEDAHTVKWTTEYGNGNEPEKIGGMQANAFLAEIRTDTVMEMIEQLREDMQ